MATHESFGETIYSKVREDIICFVIFPFAITIKYKNYSSFTTLNILEYTDDSIEKLIKIYKTLIMLRISYL